MRSWKRSRACVLKSAIRRSLRLVSQIVGTQAVFNVLTGKRWSVVSKEMKDYICGYYGKAPGPMDQRDRCQGRG